MNKLFIVLTGAGLLLIAIFLAACGPTQKDNTANNGPTNNGSPVVGEGAKTTTENSADILADAIKITVSSGGYEPSAINVKKGQSVKLAFFRKDSDNCGSEVVFASLNIKKELPVGKTVLVEFVPLDDREISFACGMGMMTGKLIVQ